MNEEAYWAGLTPEEAELDKSRFKGWSNSELIEYCIINLSPNLSDPEELPDRLLLDCTIEALNELERRL